MKTWYPLTIPPELRPPWLGNEPVLIPAEEGISPQVRSTMDGASFTFDVEETIRCLQQEGYASPMSSPTLKIPFPYILLPAWMRLLAAKTVFLPKRFFRKNGVPPWPVAVTLDVLNHVMGRFARPAWDGKRWAMALTFDVDTAKGLRRCPSIADEVERAGFRACFYIVGAALNQEPALVRELFQRGHEIGSHDVLHDNRIAFLPARDMDDRLKHARDLIAPFQGGGFRSPSLFRSAEMIEHVGRYFRYDSSLCDTDLEHHRGCTTVFPYRLRGGIELPITLPMDSSLIYIGYTPAAMHALWKTKCGYIRSLGGLAMLVCHAEPHLTGGTRMLQTFNRFLDWVRGQSDLLVLLPSHAASRIP